MIEVKNLSKIYNKGKRNEVRACDDISLKLEDTGLYAIFGKSGAGKSSFMNALGGLDKYSSGTITYDNKTFKKNVSDKCRIANIGYIFQNYLLDASLNVYDNVAFGLKSIGIKDEETIFNRTMTALANVGMAKFFKRNVTTLSGGQQQRVAIARAMAKGSKIILADEPTGNLDVENTRLVMNILKELSKTRMVIIVTHEVDIVETYADKIIEINDGKIVNESKGVSSNLKNDYGNKIFLKELPKVTTELGGIVVEKYGADCPINIKVINNNGKLYLKADNANLKILDNTNEVELINDTREEYESKRKESLNVKLRNLDPIAPKHSGQVFSFKDSVIVNKGHSKKQKIRNGFLATTLCLLVISIVFIFASWGASYKKIEVLDHYRLSPYLSVKIDNPQDYINIKNKLNENNINIVSFDEVNTYPDNYDSQKYYSAQLKDAEFKSNVGDDGSSSPVNVHIIFKEDQKCLIGNVTEFNKDVLVSTGFLKSIVETTRENDYNYKVDEQQMFNDAIGKHLQVGDQKGYNITGVVEDEYSKVYINILEYAKNNNENIKVLLPGEKFTPSYSSSDEIEPEADTLYVSCNNEPPKDEQIPFMINGKEEILKIKYNRNYTEFNHCSKATFLKFKELLLLKGETNYNKINNLTLSFDSEEDFNSAKNIINQIIVDKDDENSYMTIWHDYTNDISQIAYAEKLDLYVMNIVTGILFGLILIISLLITIVNFMDKKKEVGLYRAIGVSKANVVYKYFLETLVTVISWVFLILVVLGVIMVLCSYFPISKDIPFLNGTLLYLDWWQLLLMIGVIIPSLMFLSIIPPLSYMGKSPIEILANYDM